MRMRRVLFLLAAALLALPAMAAPAGIPGQAAQDHRSLSGRQRHGRGGARARPMADRQDGAARHRRQPPGRLGVHCGTGGGRCGAGRVHGAPDDQHHARRQPGDVQEAALRPGEGLRAGQHGRQRRIAAARAGSQPSQGHRLLSRAAARRRQAAELRRRQLLQPHRRRAAQDRHRRRSAGSAVQGHAARR